MTPEETLPYHRDLQDAINFMCAGLDAMRSRIFTLNTEAGRIRVKQYANQIGELSRDVADMCDEISAKEVNE